MTKLQQEHGRKGLKVVSITSESLPTVLKFFAQVNAAPVEYTIGAKGGYSFKRTDGKNTIPYVFLVGVDGNVVWQGSPGNLSEDTLEAELRKVKVTDEMKKEKAEKALQFAEGLVAQKRYVVAGKVLGRIAADFKGTEPAKKAEERKAALEKDESIKKELAAQKELEKIVGGLDLPKEKLKGKERASNGVRLEGFIKKHKEDAPGSAELASMWQKVMKEDWKRED